VGQMLFVLYLVVFYGGALLRNQPADWNKVMPHGYIVGDTAGNLAIGLHLCLAVVVMLGGTLQLLPWLRANAPAFHRWTGRTYATAACATSVVGLYLVWFRGSTGDLLQHLGISLDAVFILVFAILAVRAARAGDFVAHRQWALRLFMVVSAVWFFRVGLMFWIFINKGPVGFNPDTFEGPFLSFLAFAQTLLPLTVLELYLRAQRGASAAAKLSVAALLFMLTLAMGIGTAIAFMGMWLPRL
jgi:uncharacterized membrane protein